MEDDDRLLKSKAQKHISTLLKFKVLDSTFEQVFYTITKLASDICETPLALISVKNENRQWFKAVVGMQDVAKIPNEFPFCASSFESNELLEVPDVTQDDRFLNNPLVIEYPDIRFYCGAPIQLPLGEKVGTICVMDTKANYLTDAQRKTLSDLAKLIAQLLVVRETNLRARAYDRDSLPH
jgi:GAF domain-containing protein